MKDKVKAERDKNNRKVYRDYWWHYAEKRPALYGTIAGMKRFLVHPLTSKHHTLAFYAADIVASHMTVVLALEGWGDYALVQSESHWKWVLEYGNKLETRPQYTPLDCFETFPFPSCTDSLSDIRERYYKHRQSVMTAREEGLTKVYNCLHSGDDTSKDISQLRDLHVDMDRAVAAAYGWTDLDLGHGFHETKQGLRFTISARARREVLGRLLKLNHERDAEDVAAGLVGDTARSRKSAGRRPRLKGTATSTSLHLFK